MFLIIPCNQAYLWRLLPVWIQMQEKTKEEEAEKKSIADLQEIKHECKYCTKHNFLLMADSFMNEAPSGWLKATHRWKPKVELHALNELIIRCNKIPSFFYLNG